MKKFNSHWLFLIALFISGGINAQEILQVTPGLGTLNDAIDANGGSKIYQLQADAWYGLTKIIENVDYHLQIIGEPYDDETMPATLQTGSTTGGQPFDEMFAAKGDITLQNIYLVNADLNGQISGQLMRQSSIDGRIVIKNCIMDPIGLANGIVTDGGMNKLYLTDNIICRHGHMVGANDGSLFIIYSSASNEGIDTAWIENNTFISTGTNLVLGDFNNYLHNFILWNHNTFCHHKSQLDWATQENEYYFTNNLMFDFMTSPYAYTWQPMPGGDVGMPKPALIYADTLPEESLPSSRVQYIQYNSLYRSQGFYDLISELNALDPELGKPKVNLHPLIWDGTTPAYYGADPAEAFNACREAQMFNWEGHDVPDFPNWKYGNTMVDVDPLFNDPMIYQMSDSLIKWQGPASYVHALGFPSTDYPPASEWAKWHWEPDGDVSINDTWPLFDGTYTDPATLKGSIEYLPLGDLNWWPELKALWEADKERIWEHMKAGNTERIGLTNVPGSVDNGVSFSKIYPNPVITIATIQFSMKKSADVDISIYNSLGQRVLSVLNEYKPAGTHTISFDRGDLNNGMYFYTIRAGDRSETHKIIIAEVL